MKIAISGASGFVGTHITEIFALKGYEVVPLGRQLFEEGSQKRLEEAIAGCEVVINLAGATINHRWTKRYKQMMYDSRIGVTRKIVAAINALDRKPKVFISTSAVGCYPSEGCFDENSTQVGSSFLSKLCIEWEKESQKVSPEVRLVNARFGVILAAKGGAFSKMVKSAKMGIATIIGNGNQPFSWIDLEDHGRAIEFIVENSSLNGAVNLVSPEILTNRSFTKQIARYYRSLLTIRIPKFFFSLMMGESAELLTEGQCVKSTKLLEHGFAFNVSTIEQFLNKK